MIRFIRPLVIGAVVALTACAKSNGGESSLTSGNEAGNGGHGVVCRTADGTNSVELLDFYEARILMPELAPDMASGQTELEKVHRVLDRLERLDPERAARYRATADIFFADSRFIDRALLGSTNDFGYVPLEVGCHVEQIAVQRKTAFPELKRYSLQQSLWERLTPEHRAGLILHEVVYGQALELGHRDSVSTRYLTALISSHKIDTMDVASFDALMQAIGLAPGGSSAAAPSWITDMITLPSARAGEPWETTLRPYVRYAGSAPLKFVGHDLPTGLTLDSDGRLWTRTFTIEARTEMLMQFPVAVLAVGGEEIKASVMIRVLPGAGEGPHWLSERVLIPSPLAEVPYRVDVGSWVQCGSRLTFRAKNMAPWMDLSSDGVLSGTPLRTDAGNVQFSVTATCHGVSKTAVLFGEVRATQQAPLWLANPIEARALAGRPFRLELRDSIANPEAHRLQFRMLSGPAFVKINVGGTVSGTPALADVGDFVAAVEVSNGSFSEQASLLVHVDATNLAPFWVANPIEVTTAVNQAFFSSLKAYVQNDSGKSLTFVRVDGPPWMTIQPSGLLMGTPSAANVGENVFHIEFRAEDGESRGATLVVTVR